jgi:hypothetical protein
MRPARDPLPFEMRSFGALPRGLGFIHKQVAEVYPFAEEARARLRAKSFSSASSVEISSGQP